MRIVRRGGDIRCFIYDLDCFLIRFLYSFFLFALNTLELNWNDALSPPPMPPKRNGFLMKNIGQAMNCLLHRYPVTTLPRPQFLMVLRLL